MWVLMFSQQVLLTTDPSLQALNFWEVGVGSESHIVQAGLELTV